MAFTLARGRPIAEQLRRIVRKELRAAHDQLSGQSPDQNAIHEARKSVKKARAVLRLLRDALGSHYNVERKQLRDAAHALASLREADAMVATVESLRGRYRSVVTAEVAREICGGLQRRRRRVRAHAAPALGRARRALERTERSAPKWVGRVGQFAAMRSGTVRGYRRARDASRDLTPDADASLFHCWRKRVKDLEYHMRLLAGLHRTPRGRARTLHQLEALLGEEHDLATLQNEILGAPDRYGGARTSTLVLGAITKRQATLRKNALALGHRTFAESPSKFDDAVVTWRRAR